VGSEDSHMQPDEPGAPECVAILPPRLLGVGVRLGGASRERHS